MSVLRLILVLSLVFWTGFVMAAVKLDQDQPITLEADKATFNERTGVTTYVGNVTIQQGSLRIFADSIVAQLSPNRSIIGIQAKGSPVRFEQKLPQFATISRGQAKQLQYLANQSLIVLTGQAKLEHNGGTFTGHTLRYSMTVGDIEAKGQGDNRVRIVIPPNLNRQDGSAKSKR